MNGLNLVYADHGQGRPVVFIHGALTTLEDGLIALSNTLLPKYRLISFDRPGHGRSERGYGTGSAWCQAEMIHDAIGQLGIERPVIMGHSFGGAVALAYALQFPNDVTGVVAAAPIAYPEPRLEQFVLAPRSLPLAGSWLNAVASPLDGMMLPILWEAMFLPQTMPSSFREGFPFDLAGGRKQMQADGDDAALMIASLARNAAQYWTCKVPVRVLQGTRDVVVNPVLHGRLVAAALPRGRFQSLPGLGHMLHHYAPAAIVEAVDALFDED